MLKALFKYDRKNRVGIDIDTTCGVGDYAELSPFVLKTTDPLTNRTVLFENLWQFSKVYKCFLNADGSPTESWWYWRRGGITDNQAHRYPMGKGAIPEYSYWIDGVKLGYIDARKTIYAPYYAKAVKFTRAYENLKALYDSGKDITLRDYDAYDHQKLGMTLKDVINNPNRKMGHAFVLLMMLTDQLDECLGAE